LGSDKIRKIIGCILLVSLMSLGFVKPVKEYVLLPNSLTVFENQQLSMQTSLQADAAAADSEQVFSIKTGSESLQIEGRQSGVGEIVFDLAGIPIKKVDVKVLEDFRVIPGGQSIGVKLNSLGVLVVGHHQIKTSGEKNPPEK
jgi:stage IV sporulation protein B